jgi:hypothetical protein
MAIRKIITAVVVVIFSTGAVAQGAFDFGDIPGVNQQPMVDVNLNQTMLGFVRTMAGPANPEAADLLAGLRSVRVRVYGAQSNARQFNNFIDNVTEALEGTGWLRVVYVQDGDAKVRMHMQMTEEEVSGLTVMVIDDSEAVFINIDGSISAEDLGKVMAMLPVQDVLGSLGLPPTASVD